jgi:proteasome beta subunit
MNREAAVAAAVEALYDAADEDTATGGPDLVRGIFPSVATVTAEGYRRVDDAEVRAVAERVVASQADWEG